MFYNIFHNKITLSKKVHLYIEERF
jgi:hypothetical protein